MKCYTLQGHPRSNDNPEPWEENEPVSALGYIIFMVFAVLFALGLYLSRNRRDI